MGTAAALRITLERSLQHRFPAALTPSARTIYETASTGIPVLDSLLDGGLPVGAISEISGQESSGRTSLALSFLARRTQDAQVCAWVDAGDALDPESAAANGVDLRRLLWVRCGTPAAKPQPSKPGTPMAATSALSQLDQALRSADLLLQAGGFAAIVLDLGSIDPASAMRIPLATWFRFRQAADHARTSLLVLGRDSYAQSSAALVLDCAPLRARAAGKAAHQTVLTSLEFHAERGRQRFAPAPTPIRKPPASTWSANCTWDISTAPATEKRA